jgi:hypothetical protein
MSRQWPWVVLAAAVMATPAFAETSAGGLTYSPPALPTSPGAGSLLLRLAALTLLSLTACAVVAWLARSGRWRARPPAGGPARLVSVAGLALDRRCSLHLLNVGGRRVVVGLDPAGLKSMLLLPESFADHLAPVNHGG